MNSFGTPGTSMTALEDAIRRGKYGQARLIVEGGADVNTRTGCGDTPLMLCCDQRVDLAPQTRINLVKLLIESGADTNCQDSHGNSALMKAVGLGCRLIVSLIVSNRTTKAGLQDHEGNTALMMAAAAGLTDVVSSIVSPWSKLHQMFLLHQVNHHGHTAVQQAINNGHDHVASALGGSSTSRFFKMQAPIPKFPSPNLLNADSSPSPSPSPERPDACHSPQEQCGNFKSRGSRDAAARMPKPCRRDEFDKVLKFLDAAIRREDASWDGKEDDNRMWTPEGSSSVSTGDNFPDRVRRPRLVGGNFFPPIRNMKGMALLNDKYLKKRLSNVYSTNLNA